MKILIYIWMSLLLFVVCETAGAESKEHAEGADGKVDVQEIIFGHVMDSYEWHVTKWAGKEIVIPLPVILYSPQSGWHAFLSSKLSEGGSHRGFYIAKEGVHGGKIVERDVSGKETRLLDFSITKTVLSLFINSLLLVFIILGVARYYKKRRPEDAAPKGFVGFMEMFITMVNDDIIKTCIGKDYRRYAPYLLTAFFFIFLNNLMGLLPVFPGGGNVTGNIAVTLVLACMTFLAVNIWGTKEYWKEILWPEVPLWLKVPIPVMPLIELFGIFTKPFALTVRLFANIVAGHSVILALTCVIFITTSLGPALNGSMTVISVLFSIFMNCMELLVAFIQAYVFTMLSAVFIGLSRVKETHKK